MLKKLNNLKKKSSHFLLRLDQYLGLGYIILLRPKFSLD